MPCVKARFYSFTLFNYDKTKLDALRSRLQEEDVRYAIFGHEETKEGKPHLQGYIAFRKQKALSTAKKVVGNDAHLEICKGNQQQNIDYCSKDGNIEEFGEKETNQGKRSELEAFADAVKGGERSLKKLREDFKQVCAKYPRFVNDYIRDQIPDPPIQLHQLRDWQFDLNNRLKEEANSRHVIFVIDFKGNKGKSWFAKYYCSQHDDAMILRPTKHADMAYALPPTLRVLFLDCTRKQVEYMPYTFMEECKDGYVFSNKYESCVKKYAPMHVVVMMNQEPDMSALSEDRYVMMNLDEPTGYLSKFNP